MPPDNAEIQTRTNAALKAIKAAYGTADDEFGATLFVSHHLEELAASYWEKHFQAAKPAPEQILDVLVLQSDFDEEEDLDSLDFTLPGEVTDYVLCVSFDEDGAVEAISMES